MKLYYDFHIHTALSPCGDDDMTPNNIVNMSVLKGLDAIAITDHNSAKNARACFECGKKAGLIVLPGMEIETMEEVHILALFSTPDSAEELDAVISAKLPFIKNRKDIFGEQFIMDCNDEIQGTVPNLLSTATELSVKETLKIVRDLGGVAIPAHVDKSSYSIISNLGFVSSEFDFTALEYSKWDLKDAFIARNQLGQYKGIHSSDAHYLWDISEREYFFDFCDANAVKIIDYLRQKA